MIYWIAWFICNCLLILLGHRRVAGLRHVPRQGPVILAPNHISYLDPVAVGTGIRRRLAFMAKAEAFRVPIFGWLLRKLRAFPVRRGAADRAALKRALDLLAAGEALMIFPEGTRSLTGELQAPEIGVGMLAVRSGAPVVPVRVWGTDQMLPRGARFLRPAPVRVAYGPPLRFSPPAGGKPGREEYEAAARQIMAAIAALEPPK
ncbi:MAG: 1-acyl-sn-glycerol-3-phosphate acyltransferase [Armatimonadetes bacterium]|nr:1-acyl-sn-glycerol-3-phosphate acyltransferase [Armatimonadota bacterium]